MPRNQQQTNQSAKRDGAGIRPSARVRLENFRRLISEAGSTSALARRAGTSASYLSQVKNRIPAESGRPRGIGERLAARLEQAMGKPSGWLDEPHGAAAPRVDAEKPGGDIGATGPPEDGCPLLSWTQAGDRPEVDKATGMAGTTYQCAVRCSPDTYVLRVRDAGMVPMFHEGELIFVDPKALPDAGRYVVVRTAGSGEATFRQLIESDGRRYLRALNPDWPQPIVEATGSVRICGVVVFRGAHV